MSKLFFIVFLFACLTYSACNILPREAKVGDCFVYLNWQFNTAASPMMKEYTKIKFKIDDISLQGNDTVIYTLTWDSTTLNDSVIKSKEINFTLKKIDGQKELLPYTKKWKIEDVHCEVDTIILEGNDTLFYKRDFKSGYTYYTSLYSNKIGLLYFQSDYDHHASIYDYKNQLIRYNDSLIEINDILSELGNNDALSITNYSISKNKGNLSLKKYLKEKQCLVYDLKGRIIKRNYSNLSNSIYILKNKQINNPIKIIQLDRK